MREAALMWRGVGVNVDTEPSEDGRVLFWFGDGILRGTEYSGLTKWQFDMFTENYTVLIDRDRTKVGRPAVIAHEIGHVMRLVHVPTMQEGGFDSVMNTGRSYADARVTEYDRKTMQEMCGWR